MLKITTKEPSLKGAIELDIDGKQVSLSFPLTDPSLYRKAVEMMNFVQGIGQKSLDVQKTENLSADEKGKALLLHLCRVIESYQDLVRHALGSDQYQETLGAIDNLLPLTAWEEICYSIIDQFTGYFATQLDTGDVR